MSLPPRNIVDSIEAESPIGLLPEWPQIEEYIEQRELCGLSSRSREAVLINLENSLFVTIIRHEGMLVGMGRVISDRVTVLSRTLFLNLEQKPDGCLLLRRGIKSKHHVYPVHSRSPAILGG